MNEVKLSVNNILIAIRCTSLKSIVNSQIINNKNLCILINQYLKTL